MTQYLAGLLPTRAPQKLNLAPEGLPLREWLELGQWVFDQRMHPVPKWFRSDFTEMISIGIPVKIDGKTFAPGRYILDRSLP